MNFAEAISSGLSKYVQFGGRASRSEYWYWTLFVIIATIVANIIDATLGIGFVGGIVGLGLFLPGLAVSARSDGLGFRVARSIVYAAPRPAQP